jgi:hypothetical protein
MRYVELEEVDSFNYVGSVVNHDNTKGEEIKERISVGNKVFCANKKVMFSKLLKESSKIFIYKSLIRPLLTCGCETWVLKDIHGHLLRVLERKVMKIHGPIKIKMGVGE